MVVWFVTPRSLVGGYRVYRRTCCLNFEGFQQWRIKLGLRISVFQTKKWHTEHRKRLGRIVKLAKKQIPWDGTNFRNASWISKLESTLYAFKLSSGCRSLGIWTLRISLTPKRLYGQSDFQIKSSYVKAFQNLSEDKVSRNVPDWVCVSRGVGQKVNRKMYNLLLSLHLVLNNGAWRIFSR